MQAICCWKLLRVGYLWCVTICSPPHPNCLRPEYKLGDMGCADGATLGGIDGRGRVVGFMATLGRGCVCVGLERRSEKSSSSFLLAGPCGGFGLGRMEEKSRKFGVGSGGAIGLGIVLGCNCAKMSASCVKATLVSVPMVA